MSERPTTAGSTPATTAATTPGTTPETTPETTLGGTHAATAAAAAGATVGPSHPLLVAVAPLLTRLDAEVVAVSEAAPSDVPLVWEGETVAAVRLPAGGPGDPPAPSEGGVVADLDTLLVEVARELGGSLAQLGRADKQHAVRLLEERGAFRYRRSAEGVAEALGVTRFTVYNYLNRGRS